MWTKSAGFLIVGLLLSMTLASPSPAAPVLFAGSLIQTGPANYPLTGTGPTTMVPGFLQVMGSTVNAPFTLPASTLSIARTASEMFPSYPGFFWSFRRPVLAGAFSVGGGGVMATTTINANTTAFPNLLTSPRQGFLRLVPGPNFFGGTARHLHDDYYYLGWQPADSDYVNIVINANSNTAAGGPLGNTQAVTTGTRVHTDLTTGGTAMNPLVDYSRAVRTGAPWITGMVTAYAPAGYYVTTRIATGSNMRTSMGRSGTISLVTPTLLHAFRTDSDPENITSHFGGYAYQTRITLEFLPEPAQGLMLGAGVLSLLALRRGRRHHGSACRDR